MFLFVNSYFQRTWARRKTSKISISNGNYSAFVILALNIIAKARNLTLIRDSLRPCAAAKGSHVVAATKNPCASAVNHRTSLLTLLRAGFGHHLLELVKANIAVTVGVKRSDHLLTVLHRALLPQLLQHLVELYRRDQPVLIPIVQLKRITQLSGVGVAPRLAELGELLQVYAAVVIGVDLLHHTAHLLGRRLRSEGPQHVGELGAGDLAVAVGVEAVEDLLQFILILRIDIGLGGFRNRIARHWNGADYVRERNDIWILNPKIGVLEMRREVCDILEGEMGPGWGTARWTREARSEWHALVRFPRGVRRGPHALLKIRTLHVDWNRVVALGNGQRAYRRPSGVLIGVTSYRMFVFVPVPTFPHRIIMFSSTHVLLLYI